MMDEIREKLIAPFPASDIRWRVGSTTKDKSRGLALPYLDARAIQERLDAVFGWDGWTTEYRAVADGIVCKLSVRVDTDRWVSKEDGAPLTDIEPLKGGVSDAFKRVAASGFGIGRYLYALPAQWCALKPAGRSYALAETPQLPPGFLPAGDTPPVSVPPSLPPTEFEAELNRPEPPYLSRLKQVIAYYKISNSTVLGWLKYYRVDALDQLAEGQVNTLIATCKKHFDVQREELPAETPAKPPNEHLGDLKPACPVCGGEMWYNPPDGTKKPRYKCKNATWNKATRTAGGCPGVFWSNEEAQAGMAKSAAPEPVPPTSMADDDDIPF